MSTEKKIKVIILNYNSVYETIELYQQLLSYSHPFIDILIIDNQSDKTDIEILTSKIPHHQLLLNDKNLGYAGGNNIGINLSVQENFDYTLILNPDIRLTPDTIPTLLASYNTYPQAAAIGPRICYRNEPQKIYSDGGMVDKEKGYLVHHLNYQKDISEVSLNSSILETDYVNGSCILINNEVVRKIGPLKDYFFLYFEETEWCLRAKNNGYLSYINTHSITYHLSSKKSKNYHYFIVRNRILLAKIEKQYYTLTRNKIFKNLLKELLDIIIKGKLPKYWWTRMRGLLSATFYTIKE